MNRRTWPTSFEHMVNDKPDVREDLYNLTTHEKLVLYALEVEGPLTMQELMEVSRLSRSTATRACSNLQDRGFVEKRREIRNPSTVRYAECVGDVEDTREVEKYAEVNTD